MSDTQDTGAGAGNGNDEGTPAKTSGGTGGKESGNPTSDHALNDERSANKLIKDFAKARGVTVAQLIARMDDLENANKSDLQKAMDKAADWERKHGDLASELRTERAEKQVRDAAASANARPDRLAAVWRLVKDDIAYDGDGKPSNVAALVAQAKADSPEWFAAVAGSGDGGKTGATDQDPNAAINAAIRRATGHSG